MQVNRRSFIKGAAALSVVPASLLVTGCSTITDLINTVLNAAANVLVAEPGAPWVAQMQQAIAALEQAEQSWQAGGAVAVVIDALNTVEAVCAVIPLTAVYSPLIDILVAGIEAVLALFPADAVQASKAKVAAPNPHIGRFTLAHKAFHARQDEFKAQWNLVAVGPLAGAAIK